MRNQPKQLLPLIYAIESAEDAVRHLTTVYESLMTDIENGDTPILTESDRKHLKFAESWQHTAKTYTEEFKGGLSDA